MIRAGKRGTLSQLTRKPQNRCCGCGYGAVRRSEPQRCPMCGSTTWEIEGWRPYAELFGEVELHLVDPVADETTAPAQREASELEASRQPS